MSEEIKIEEVKAEKSVFTADIRERVVAILMWPLCFLYASMLFEAEGTWNTMFTVFSLLFIALAEGLYWQKKRSWESIAILIMTVIIAVSVWLPYRILGPVFESGYRAFFTHLFAVYWVLCRANTLSEGETSHMMLWDGITGFFIMPFGSFLLNMKTLGTVFKVENKEEKKKALSAVLLACLAALILLAIALSYLMHADANYNHLMEQVFNSISIDIDETLAIRLAFTVIISMYLYGLLGGCYRDTAENVVARTNNVKKNIASLRKVSGVTWLIFVALFSLFYVIFFAMQGRFLIDAFIMKLPAGVTYSQFARRGFGDMCGVTVINFILLWLMTRTSVNYEKPIKAASLILNGESMLFAIIAFLKIMMYINAYGFTPLRLQSIWAAVVLFYACICVMINILTRKKTAKPWFLGSAATLAILCII